MTQSLEQTHCDLYYRHCPLGVDELKWVNTNEAHQGVETMETSDHSRHLVALVWVKSGKSCFSALYLVNWHVCVGRGKRGKEDVFRSE